MPPSVFYDEDGNKVLLVPIRERTEMVGRKYIRAKLGCSNSELSKRPWHFPDFGEKIYGHYGAEPYTKKEVDAWLSIPAKVRRERYREWKDSGNESKE